MKIIEAMKQIKDLQKKAMDLRDKVKRHCSYLSAETPVYGDQEKQKAQVTTWIQAHSDIMKEILKLRVAIQKTNLATSVTIELGGKAVTKNIAEWIHRRRDLAALECDIWEVLGEKEKMMREGTITDSSGAKVEVKILRCYDPLTRDQNIDLYDNEPSVIDSKLEVVNAVTDVIE